MQTTEIGFTPEFETIAVKRAAQLVAKGFGVTEAIERALIWTRDLYVELAVGQSERSLKIRDALSARIWHDINGTTP